MGEDNGWGGERVFRNNSKRHMDKIKAEWKQGREVRVAGMMGE